MALRRDAAELVALAPDVVPAGVGATAGFERLHPDRHRPEIAFRGPVCSYNEWDPLEEVIVGRVDGATIPASHIAVTFNLPQVGRKLYRSNPAPSCSADICADARVLTGPLN
jgi:hypothetical protein